jgi:hypothetical protein
VASINRIAQIYSGVSTMGNPELLSTGIPIPRFSMSQFTDMAPYVLALLAKLLAHVTTISQDRSLISCRVFRLSTAEMYSSSGFAIRESRYADIMTAGPTMDAFHFVGISDFEISKCMDFLSMGSPISRWMTILSGLFPHAPIAATRPPKMDGPDRFS